MKQPSIKCVGYNGFNQFRSGSALPIFQFEEIDVKSFFNDEEVIDFHITASWSYCAFAVNKKLILQGFLKQKPGNNVYLNFEFNIKQIACSERHCLILMENGKLQQYLIAEDELKALNFLSVENKLNDNEKIIQIACGETINVAITNNNSIYNIPSKIFQFPKHQKILKVICGFEHAILLTRNGDIYTWGNGLRGQLGHGDLEPLTEPKLLIPLDGIKITDISAGGWHSAAVSAFGDLYTWGWNVNGQLGFEAAESILRKAKNDKQSKSSLIKSVYASPEIVDIYDNLGEQNDENADDNLDNQIKVVSVACGARHTVIKTEDNQLFAAGSCEFGQIGMDSDSNEFFDRFCKIGYDVSSSRVICGNWSTMLIEL